MPLKKVTLRPGVNRENTRYTNENGWYSSDKVRFRQSTPEKIGGWVRLSTNVFRGVCRSLWNWITLGGLNLLGVGTNFKFYISSGGTYYDITPIRSTTAAGEVYFTATNGSATLTVFDYNHGAVANDFVTFSGAVSLGGNITDIILNQEYQVVSIVDNNSYTITAYQTQTALNGNISATDLTIPFMATTGIPVSGTIQIGSERITYTGISSGNFIGCTRGVSSTTAVSHAYGDTVYVLVFANSSDVGAASTLNGALTASSTTPIALTSTTGFSASGVVLVSAELTNPDELISYTSVVGSTLAGTITRGVGGTTGAIHSSGATVTQMRGGSLTVAAYQTNTGAEIASVTTGWGVGPWGSGAWGVGAGNSNAIRIWSQINFGEDLIFGPIGGAIYYWDATGTVSSRGVLLSSLTGASDVPTVQNWLLVSDLYRFVFALGCNPIGSTTQNPMLIRWSDAESATNWTPSVTNQAGELLLSHGSKVITGIQARQEILIWTDTSLYSLQYLNTQDGWASQLVGDNLSLVGPNAVAYANGTAYWMGTDKFYQYNGKTQTLICDLRQYIYGDINLDQSYQFVAGTNEGFNEVWFWYCSANSTVLDRYVVYNYAESDGKGGTGIWYYGNMGRTAWLDSALQGFPLGATYYSNIVQHESGVDDNSTSSTEPIVATITSAEFDLDDGDRFMFVRRVLPDLTFRGSTATSPFGVLTLQPLKNSGSGYTSPSSVGGSGDATVTQTVAGTSYTIDEFTGQVYIRMRGRQMSMNWQSTGTGVTWQLGSMRLDVQPDGRASGSGVSGG